MPQYNWEGETDKGESKTGVMEAKSASEVRSRLEDLHITASKVKKKGGGFDIHKLPGMGTVEVKTLVVEDKWLATLAGAVSGEMDRISQALTQRVKELAERYETPLPQAAAKVTELEQKVNQHLEKMGFSWN